MQSAIRISLTYFLLAFAWIIFSDRLLEALVTDANLLADLQSVKGTFFVLVTALLLFALVRSEIRGRASQEEHYRMLFFDNPLPMWIFEQESLRFLAVNDAAIQQYGYSHAEFMRMTIKDIRPAEDVPLLMNDMVSLGRKAPDSVYTGPLWRHQTKDGQIMTVSVHGHQISWDGVPSRLVVVHDLTERLAIEAERSQAQADLEREKALRELRNRFMAAMAHQLRNALTVMQTSTDLLSLHGERYTPEKRQQKYDQIRRSIGYLNRIMDQIMRARQLETQEVTLQPSPIDTEVFLQGLLERLQSLRETLPPIEFETKGLEHPLLLDPDLADHIIYNLLSNAAKYSPADKPICLNAHYDADAAQLEIKLSDQGIGIPSEDLPSLFDPFFRAANVGNIPGTGLGLSIVRDYVDLLGGTISCESVVDEGTTFKLILPCGMAS